MLFCDLLWRMGFYWLRSVASFVHFSLDYRQLGLAPRYRVIAKTPCWQKLGLAGLLGEPSRGQYRPQPKPNGFPRTSISQAREEV